MLILYLIVFIGLTGVGIIIPLFPFFGENVGASPSTITLLMSVFALGQFASSPFWGWLSDRYGRKPIFLITLFGSSISYLILGISDSVLELLLSRLLAGLMAGNVPVAFASAADVSDIKDRSTVMGRIGASFALGFIFGPAIGGFMSGSDPESVNFLMVSIVAGSMSLTAFFVTLIFYKETLPVSKSKKNINSIKQDLIKNVMKYFFLPVIGILIFVNFIFVSAGSILDSTFALWANREHNFGPREIGYLFTFMGIVMAGMQGLAVGPLSKRIGDEYVIYLSLLLYLLGLILLIISSGLISILTALVFFPQLFLCFFIFSAP